MRTQHHIIYVPGLGDPRYGLQGWALNLWRVVGVRPHYFPMHWRSQEPFEPKFERLLTLTDSLLSQGHFVSFVGTSAGASAVINAYAARPEVAGVVCICGKLRNPQTISERTYQKNSAFRGSMNMLPASLDRLSAFRRRKILSIHPYKDNVVPPADTIISGANEKSIPSSGHAFSIAFCLLFVWPVFVSFLKRQR